MTDQWNEWNGVLKTPSGAMITRVYYSVIPGQRLYGRSLDTFTESIPPMPGKKTPDRFRLLTEKEISSFDISTGEAILETDEGHRYKLIFEPLLPIPRNPIEAIGTEISN
ncbi:MAG: hypothetical protein JW934_07955 [Anaerolineae bacterium]|nr:hypothetical protein [Anaerolineae bacterium]